MGEIATEQGRSAALLRSWVQERSVAGVDVDAVVSAALQAAERSGAPRERGRDYLSGALLAVLHAADPPDRAPVVDRLVGLWAAQVMRWSRTLCSASVSPDDVSQDVLLVLVRDPPVLQRTDGLRQWLWGVTWRTVRGYRRKAWVRKWLPGAADEPDWLERLPGHSDWSEDQVAIKQLLDKLPEADRLLLWLAYAEGSSREEICAHLQMAEGTLARKLTAARKRMEALASAGGLRLEGLP